MPDLTAIAQGLSALKAIKDIGEAMIGVRDAAAFRERQIEFQGKIIEAQDAIFSIQQERSSLIEKIGELEEEIANLKKWDTEKQHCKLVEVGLGSFAYVITQEAQGSAPEYLICPACYEHGKKSIVQAMTQAAQHASGRGDERTCPDCKTKVAVARNPQWKPSTDRRW
jgi:predicted nuclease with TOPRIM domain